MKGIIATTNRKACLLAMLSMMLLSGCIGKVQPVDSTPVALPASFSQSGEKILADKWWLSFNDPGLNRAIGQALEGNFSLKSSWDRLSQARAVYRKSSAALLPAIDGEGAASHAIDHADGSSVRADKLLLGLSVSYEVDLWGQIESEVEASRKDMEATAADLDTAAMTLVAEVARSWYLLAQQTASLTLLEEQIDTNLKALELISAQFRTGQISIADVLQQRQLIESQKGEKELLLSQKGETGNQLAILLGKVPGTAIHQTGGELVELPELPATGIPATLIRSRPDIRSAFLDLEAADRRVAVAVADRYPALRLTGSLETFNGSASTIFSDYLASVMAGLTGPIFDGGARKAEVDRTRAVAEERLHDYGQVVLNAVGEVEDALLRESKQQSYIESLEVQLELATRTIEQVKERYLKGVENYQRVLTALTSLQSLQQNRLTAQKDLLVNRVELCRALGGGWDYSLSKGNI